MIALEAISPSGDKVKVGIEGERISLIMSCGTTVFVRDNRMDDFFRELERQEAEGTGRSCAETHLVGGREK